LVFVTKYRRNVLTDVHRDFLKVAFAKICEDYDATLIEMDGEDDHVHLLVSYPPTVELSKMVNSLKGASSRLLRSRYSVRTHKDHLWSPSYFAASCGGAPLDIIRKYIENQRKPQRHW
jgi:putative transposase